MTDENQTPRSGAAWTFLTNHAHVLICIDQEPSIRVRDLAQRVGITERGIQRIIAELEEAGYLTHTREGRCNVYKIHSHRPLRHPVESAHTLGKLVSALGSSGDG